MNSTCIAKISFDDLFDETDPSKFEERLSGFLKNIVDSSSQTHGVSSDALVRIVHNGEILWMTQQQADQFLQQHRGTSQESSLRAAVERALKGESQNTRHELLALLGTAKLSIEHLKDNPGVSKLELHELKPFLQRTQSEIDDILKEVASMETHVANVRQDQPAIREYEAKVGEMLEKKKADDWDGARRIAMELQQKKNFYLLCCRSIEPEIRALYHRRLDLQKIKKRLLNVHRNLCAHKAGRLELEIGEIRDRVQSLQQGAAVSNSANTAREVEELSKKLEKNRKEAEALNRQNRYFVQEENRTQAVISEIACNVLKQPELDISQQVAHLHSRQKLAPTHFRTSTQSRSRMVTMERRKAN
ncbi:MAG: hypothetical protein GC154_19550 [bacterium]|nr:hypothetical protein [bacterium]